MKLYLPLLVLIQIVLSIKICYFIVILTYKNDNLRLFLKLWLVLGNFSLNIKYHTAITTIFFISSFIVLLVGLLHLDS